MSSKAMSLKGRITNIHYAEKNEGVSYSHTFIAEKETKIAIVQFRLYRRV